MPRTKVSKNKKRNWKHVDIQEIEEHLEDERLQERTGGLVADKSNEQLFFVDKVTEAVASSENAVRSSKRQQKALKCHSNLLPDPNIKPARVAHNVKQSTLKRLCAGRKQRLEQGILTTTEKVSAEQRKAAVKQSSIKRRTKNHVNIAKYDLWAEDVKNYDVEPDEHYMKVTRKRAVNVPKHHYVKPSGLAAVEVPHAGSSYNPPLDEYQSLLLKAHEIEIIKEKKEMQVIRATDDMFPDKSQAPTESDYIQEMSAGLYEAPEEDASDTEDGGLSVNPPIRREDKKTITQRNKEKKQKLETEKAQKQKEERIAKNALRATKLMKKEVGKIEVQRKDRLARKAQLKEQFKNKPKKLGRLQYEHEEIEVKLTDELEGSLRLLRPEGHLLEDRFKSLQRRNIIEPRKRAKRLRKYKLKEFEKKTHKEIVE